MLARTADFTISTLLCARSHDEVTGSVSKKIIKPIYLTAIDLQIALIGE